MLAKPVVEIAPRTWLISEYKLVNIDVYKRQRLCGYRRGTGRCGRSKKRGAGADWAGSDPVSYTHLDVYKRQGVS